MWRQALPPAFVVAWLPWERCPGSRGGGEEGLGEGLGWKVAFLRVPGPPAPGVPQGEPGPQQAGAALLGPGLGRASKDWVKFCFLVLFT